MTTPSASRPREAKSDLDPLGLMSLHLPPNSSFSSPHSYWFNLSLRGCAGGFDRKARRSRAGASQKKEDLAHVKEEKTDGDWEVVGQGSHNKKRHPSAFHKVPKENWQMFKLPPSDQMYTNAIHYGADTQPSRTELSDLSEACSKLWELDLNRLVPGKDYEIDCGEGKRAHQKGDMASGSLFKWLGDDVLRRSTYARFCSLLDNYNPQEGYKEVVTPEERHEQTAFIQEIFYLEEAKGNVDYQGYVFPRRYGEHVSGVSCGFVSPRELGGEPSKQRMRGETNHERDCNLVQEEHVNGEAEREQLSGILCDSKVHQKEIFYRERGKYLCS
ncbi:poly(U)-specific endoribonuclease [Dendrobium catenatum]|uniref:Poly(U)-specific endoribonuclease n=1 Tax=Dendrobium catenatum TaxID=906689 RepID=A0A2I0X1U9_9ASPA|nr:poly(U)-specific endoribonuclease [Dendrobium catenatum]